MRSDWLFGAGGHTIGDLYFYIYILYEALKKKEKEKKNAMKPDSTCNSNLYLLNVHRIHLVVHGESTVFV